MEWQEIRDRYPHQWLLVEAIKAYSKAGKRFLEQLTVVNVYPDALTALQGYTQLHKQSPERELYLLHTDRETIDITEHRWLGIRSNS